LATRAVRVSPYGPREIKSRRTNVFIFKNLKTI
jgi:hypothetical protein